jgi:Mg2+ and Co2+ transporter CorA|tara:strand:- start:185 stop:688 length:504 start_codon:yes stop_codon:yes gene_type:complete
MKDNSDNFRPSAAQPNPTEDRGELDLTLLLEQHKKDIWEWKQKESQWIKDKNQLDGNKKIIEELSTKLVEMAKVNLAFKKRAQEAEGETTIVKGIGMNSPEMRELQARVKQLDSSLTNALEINESHQKYNAQLQIRLTEVTEDNKKLSKQIQDYVKNHEDKFRKAGL